MNAYRVEFVSTWYQCTVRVAVVFVDLGHTDSAVHESSWNYVLNINLTMWVCVI
jgi:hypothetical protein